MAILLLMYLLICIGSVQVSCIVSEEVFGGEISTVVILSLLWPLTVVLLLCILLEGSDDE